MEYNESVQLATQGQRLQELQAEAPVHGWYSSIGLFFFVRLLGFAFPLHKIKEVNTDIKVCNGYKISKSSLPWRGLESWHVGLN